MSQAIIYVIGTLGKGGAESQLLMLMRRLPRNELTPSLFVLEASGPLRSEIEAAAIPIIDGGYDSDVTKPLKIFMLLRALWRLWLLLRHTRAQVVHGFLPLTNLITAVAGCLARTPLIVTSRRALNTHQDRVPGWRYLDYLTSHLSHVITANSEAVKLDTLRREGGNPKKIRVIYNGLDAVLFRNAVFHREKVRHSLGIDNGQIVLIIVANLIPYKGHSELIDAIARILPRHPNLHLLIAGEDRGIGITLKKQADNLGLGNVIHWLGLRHDIPNLLAASDIYVCASHEEGFSNSILEALAAGKVVIASKVGGNPEMLEQGKLGFLIESKDVNGLAEVLIELIKNPLLREHFGRIAAETVMNKYDVEQMVNQYLSLYLSPSLS